MNHIVWRLNWIDFDMKIIIGNQVGDYNVARTHTTCHSNHSTRHCSHFNNVPYIFVFFLDSSRAFNDSTRFNAAGCRPREMKRRRVEENVESGRNGKIGADDGIEGRCRVLGAAIIAKRIQNVFGGNCEKSHCAFIRTCRLIAGTTM